MPDEDEIPQDDGWIRVTSKKGAPQRFVSGVPRPDKEATLDTLTALLQKKTDLWRRSTCRKEVHKALERHRPDDGWPFDKALCLATGSFSREQGELVNRTMFQFAVFLDTVNHLSGVSSISIPMYAQDPKYTDLDREFLTTLHVETSQMNLADIELGLTQVKEHIGPNTLLFEFYMDMGWDSIRDIIEGDTLLYIGTAFQDRELINAPQRKRNTSDEFRKRDHDVAVFDPQLEGQRRTESMNQWKKSRRSTYLPHFEEDPQVIGGMMFHWKLQTDDDDGVEPQG